MLIFALNKIGRRLVRNTGQQMGEKAFKKKIKRQENTRLLTKTGYPQLYEPGGEQ